MLSISTSHASPHLVHRSVFARNSFIFAPQAITKVVLALHQVVLSLHHRRLQKSFCPCTKKSDLCTTGDYKSRSGFAPNSLVFAPQAIAKVVLSYTVSGVRLL